MFNSFQNWNAASNPFGSYLKSMEPASHAAQAIASETTDYAKKSTEKAKSYFEKFAGVKSFEEAAKLQNEFATSAYQEFLADSARFGDLYKNYLKAVFPAAVPVDAKKNPKVHSDSTDN